jgi:hypothetical protein
MQVMAASAFLPSPPPELRSKLGCLVTRLPAGSLDAQACVDLGRILYSISSADVGEAGAGGSRDGGGGGGGEGAGGGGGLQIYSTDDRRSAKVSGFSGVEGGRGEEGAEEVLRWVRVLIQRVLTRRDSPEVLPKALTPNPKPCADQKRFPEVLHVYNMLSRAAHVSHAVTGCTHTRDTHNTRVKNKYDVWSGVPCYTHTRTLLYTHTLL